MGLLVLFIVLAWFILGYKVYGSYIARKVFDLNDKRVTTAHELEDGIDYVPTNKWVVWGHHFTSIAGVGPIAGPAIAIMWGWVPVILWIAIGAVVAGAVHDFSALVISMRNKGKSIGELTANIIGPRARYLFTAISFFELWIVIAIFALIMGILFNMYPSSVFPVWMEIPIAMALSYMVFRKHKSLSTWSWVALILMYVTVVIGVFWPIKIPGPHSLEIWIIIMMVYIYAASTLPVTTLLQPRDYINAHELMVVMGLLIVGAIAATTKAPAHLSMVAPAVDLHPKGAPPLWPMLFVTVACGAISGFHSLVSSGTTSKQVDRETEAQMIGYGGMLSEGVLALLVAIAVAAGVGVAIGGKIGGTEAWKALYSSWAAASGLGAKLKAFVTGSVNMIACLFGENEFVTKFMTTVMGVFIVSFAGTSLDTATRAQRYVVQEIGSNLRLRFLTNRFIAAFVAVFTAWLLTLASPGGKGALVLWPLFGTVNQLLAGLALLVATTYLIKRKARFVFTLIPMIFMVIMTGWAMLINIHTFQRTHNLLLFSTAIAVFVLMVWLIIEAIIAISKAKTQMKK